MPSARGSVHAPADIRGSVEGKLSYDPLVDDADISVKNINGDLALNGTVTSGSDVAVDTSRTDILGEAHFGLPF